MHAEDTIFTTLRQAKRLYTRGRGRMAADQAFRSTRRPYDRMQQEAVPSNKKSTRFMGRVAYDGTAFVGWQTQPNGRGIQDLLEERLSTLLGGRVYVAGSGRTDKGVHARDQVFHFEYPDSGAKGAGGSSTVSSKVRHVQLAAALEASDDAAVASVLESVLTGPRSDLPMDIQVRGISVAPPGFHSRDSCVGKRYVYTVEEGIGSPFTSRYRWVLGRGKPLDVAKMSEAATLLTGIHDFSTFGVRDVGDPRPPVKQMRRLEVRRVHPRQALGEAARGGGEHMSGRDDGGVGGGVGDCSGEGGVVTICAECDRFLYNMMRMISGTLVQVGLGKVRVEDIADLLRARGRKGVRTSEGQDLGAKVFKAPPHGLCLETCFLDVDHGRDWMPGGEKAPELAQKEASEVVPLR